MSNKKRAFAGNLLVGGYRIYYHRWTGDDESGQTSFYSSQIYIIGSFNENEY